MNLIRVHSIYYNYQGNIKLIWTFHLIGVQNGQFNLIGELEDI